MICLLGQTAAGKTDIAVELARRLPVEIVSVDSAMVYRGMDIGTAKPSPGVLAEAPHRLIDIREPEQAYSAGEFRRDALRSIREIREAGRIPLLVGGTMLYFRALIRGLSELPGRDAAVRAAIDARAHALGWSALHGELARIDAETAARVDPGDAQRIQRALEVWQLSGRTLSDWHREPASSPSVGRFIRLALVFGDRDRLRERIRLRLEAMLEAGFVAEVEALLARPGLSADAPALRAVGYRQLARHLRGETTLAEARRETEVATARLAKRQHTWIRGDEDAQCLDPLDPATPGRISAAVEAHIGCPDGP
ncbi:tRNA (adenosine(37)-N6)-dimethylallyltransferase MiaA [Lentisalinibacter sediminis]|uniref:tRNA (adenosine(37)-N6)-dimethylallyltransferase MiaA n=1 Tax=Lentisalinibacter sediminis TaxID=2992237 RepID=UPI003865FF68